MLQYLASAPPETPDGGKGFHLDFVRASAEAAQAPAIPEPWDVSFVGAEATFSDCIVPRGPVTRFLAAIAYTVTGADGDIYLASRCNTNDLTVEIIEGATPGEVTDSEIPEDSPFIKRLLYRISKATSGGTVSCAVTADYRGQPVQVLNT